MISTENLHGLSSLVGYGGKSPYLIGGKCGSCQTLFFPERSICPHCTGQNIGRIPLSRKGKLYSYTEVYNKPPDYRGDVPYCIGRVQLPEGVFILAQLKARKDDLKLNMDMELVVEPIYNDENGVERLGYKFKPV